MKKISLIILLSITACFAQDFQRNAFQSMFSDVKANRIGDAITIIVMESSEASNQSQTSTGTNSDLGIGISGSVGTSTIPSVDGKIGSNNSFKGSGSTQTTGKVKTKISASIDSVLANGNLRINGSRKIVINGEEQLIQIKGIVRPSDIQTDNSVLSYNISEAEIVFEGKGAIDSAQRPGLLTKLFHWLF